MKYIIKNIPYFKRKYKRIKLKSQSNLNDTKEIKMEFLSFLFLAIAVFIAWKKPEKEGLAFGAFAMGTAICFIMFFIASWTSLLPYAAY